MNYGQPELRERLAAEYALGTLRGPARRRFERLLQDDPALRQIVRDWEMRINLLAETAPAVTPPAHLWPAIERRLGVATFRSPEPTSSRTNWWEWIGFWRPFGLASAAAAVALAVFTALQPRGLSPDQIAALDRQLANIEGKLAGVESTPSRIGEVNDRLAKIESSVSDMTGTSTAVAELAKQLAEVENRIAVSERAISHVAVLLDKDGRPMMDANLDLVDGRLVLRLNIRVPRNTAGKSLEVWLVPPEQGAAPRSLGLFPSDENGTSIVLPLTKDTAQALSTSALAVSLEPAGGSTTGLPTGPVLFSGAVVPVNL